MLCVVYCVLLTSDVVTKKKRGGVATRISVKL